MKAHTNGHGKSSLLGGAAFLLGRSKGDPEILPSGAADRARTMQLFFRGVDHTKTSKARLIDLGLTAEEELQTANELIGDLRREQSRLQDRIRELEHSNLELGGSLNLANMTIDGLAKRVAHHHPRKN